MSEAVKEDSVYPSSIQCVSDNEIVLGHMMNPSLLVSWIVWGKSPYQGSDEEMMKMCSSGNESMTSPSSFSTRNSDINSTKTNNFLNFTEAKSKSDS